MSLPNEIFQNLLKDDESKRKIRQQAQINNNKNNESFAKIGHCIEEMYQSHGITTSSSSPTMLQDLWLRGNAVSDHLYHCPTSQSQTTLVPLSSLPYSIRAKLSTTNNTTSSMLMSDSIDEQGQQQHNNDEDRVVELPRYLFELAQEEREEQEKEDKQQQGKEQAAANAAKSFMTRRPLGGGGNLTNKLSEYTRGVTGQCRPFRAGGLVADDNNDTTAATDVLVVSTDDTEVSSATMIEESKRILRDGSKVAWDNGTILTAPPRGVVVDFPPIGLSWKDVYENNYQKQHIVDVVEEKDEDANSNINDTKNNDNDTMNKMISDQQPKQYMEQQHDSNLTQQSQPILLKPFTTNTSTNTNTQGDGGMWNKKTFFDDDSLFGSSSSSSSEEEVLEQEMLSSQQQENEKESHETERPSELLLFSEDDINVEEDDFVSTNVEEVDQLLFELSKKTEEEREFHKQKNTNKERDNINDFDNNKNNRATTTKTSARKMWADTTLLPISSSNSNNKNNSDIYSFLSSNALAMEFPFVLDGFQQQAVVRLERNESIFVAAHTSAGKTVVAEYAFALAKQRSTRCIYTSPIKALSNQKFRDFSLKFGSSHVGLVTGDIQLNVDDATCLIMTTEILRSMLYRGANLIRDIEWVIFDEVHYVNDSERGVVWEEVIIMLPSYVNLIFLSATTPNTIEFSDWIGRTKRKPVYVITTNYRPVPLSHHLWAGNDLHKIMEGKNTSSYLEKGYSTASIALDPTKDESHPMHPKNLKKQKKPGLQQGQRQQAPTFKKQHGGSKLQAWQAQGSKNNWMSLIRYLDREFLTPTVVFSFSKKKCEEIAHMLQSLDLNTAKEKGVIRGFTIQTVARLSQNDASLPQVLFICEMVQRGIGVHHGGLLPILKEMVEILFSKNLIKVLFATETFAMGVNMPARSVVFNSIRKHDGTQFRVLEPGEYTQMAGRAGRRGLDKVGTVILCCFGEVPPPLPVLRNMLTGSSATLQSQFRLTYNMILNLLRVEDMSVESMIKRSFSEFATQRALTANEYPKLLSKGTRTLSKLNEQFNNDLENTHKYVGAEDVQDYFHTCAELTAINKVILSTVLEKTNGTGEGVLQTGRVILVTAARAHGLVRAPAIVLRISSTDSSMAGGSSITRGDNDFKLICLTLLPGSYVIAASNEGNDSSVISTMPAKIGSIGSSNHRYFTIRELNMDQILLITGEVKKKILCSDLLKDDNIGSRRTTTGAPATASSHFFSGMRAVGGKAGGGERGGGFNSDPFAGMMARGKKSSENEDHVNKKKMKSRGVGGPTAVVDDVVKYLIEIEERELQQERQNQVPVLDIRDCARCGGDDMEFRELYSRMNNLVIHVRSYQTHGHPSIEKVYIPVERKETLRKKVETLRHLLSNESLQLFPDFIQRKEVLRKLGYVDKINDTVCVKGRVACETNTCDELIVTEMIFEGILNDLEPSEIVAALSALVFQEKTNADELDMELPERLTVCCNKMKMIALNLGQLQKEQGLEIDPLDYSESVLKFGLVHVVYEWALGVPFSKICELTTVQEGSIVRSITRLDELCREVRNCARVVGNPTLYRKMESASVAIKRDIVFASSLYVS